MPFTNISQLPDSIKARLTEAEQAQWLAVYNEVFYDTGDEHQAMMAANGAVSKRWTRQVDISKVNDEQKQVFGFLSVSIDKDGNVVEDLQDDIISPLELEKAAYNYVRFNSINKVAGEMHTNIGVGELIESMVFTKAKQEALGIPAGVMPEAAWWIGYQVTDDSVWSKIKDGTYSAFSIGGRAIREAVQD